MAKRPVKAAAVDTRPPPEPEAVRFARPPWYQGRTFYACGACSAQDERRHEQYHPPEIECFNCGGKMHEWTPPGVAREREERRRYAEGNQAVGA